MNTKRMLMRLFVLTGIFFFTLTWAVPSSQAQIKELRIGIGIDADTLNPQEHHDTDPESV